ncbi:SPFH domain-containing protein [Halocatena halophila]|uniref:SPFH domain-containing protein n=1 Tax=Halocatena halophila TaxID=2814576 RepID=UPI002ED1921C
MVELAVLLVLIVVVYQSIETVPAHEKYVLTVFNKYRKLLEPGVNFVPPFVSSTHPIDMRTQTLDIAPQEVITRDNSPVTVDAIVYYKVIDAKKVFLEVGDHERAVSHLSQTALRIVFGDIDLDEALDGMPSKRREINIELRNELDEGTDKLGLRIEFAEVREVVEGSSLDPTEEKEENITTAHLQTDLLAVIEGGYVAENEELEQKLIAHFNHLKREEDDL